MTQATLPADFIERSDELLSELAELIKYWRLESGWTQEELAAKADIPLKDVQKIENGALLPSLKKLVKLASAFGLKVSISFAPVS